MDRVNRKGENTEWRVGVLAIVLRVFAVVGAVEEFAVEKLDSDNSENEMEEHVNDEDIEDVLQWVHYAVENGF